MSPANNRPLDASEIQRIIRADEARKKTNESTKKALEWPGEYNLQLLAEAVKSRKQSVEFEGGSLFVLRYHDNDKLVFVRPEKKDQFVPCGYFEYDRLRAVIA